MFAARFAAETRMKNADWLDVAAGPDLIRNRQQWPKNENCESASAAPCYTLRRIDNDISRLSSLSKIAHCGWSRLRVTRP